MSHKKSIVIGFLFFISFSCAPAQAGWWDDIKGWFSSTYNYIVGTRATKQEVPKVQEKSEKKLKVDGKPQKRLDGLPGL